MIFPDHLGATFKIQSDIVFIFGKLFVGRFAEEMA